MYCSGKVRSRWRGAVSRRLKFRPYRQAAAFVQSLGLRSQTEWRQYCRGALCGRGRRPDDIPAGPDQAYRNDGWLNWGEWLGTGTEATQLRRYRAFNSAREFVRQLGLRSHTDWIRYRNGTLWGKGKRPKIFRLPQIMCTRKMAGAAGATGWEPEPWRTIDARFGRFKWLGPSCGVLD